MTLSARNDCTVESPPSSPLSASALPLATPALPAGRTALTAGFFSFQIEVNLFAIVLSTAHPPFSISNPRPLRHAEAAFAPAMRIIRNNWMNFLFVSQITGTKGDLARYPTRTSGSHRRQESNTCQTRREAYTTRTAAPASHPAVSLPYASMQSAAPMPAPPPGEVFLCPHTPRSAAYPVPFQ